MASYEELMQKIYDFYSNEPIMESYIFSEDNLELNIDKWKPGTPLWITGTSGDGKSTLAREYAEKYNAIIISTDTLLCRIGFTKEKYERKFMNPDRKFGADDKLSLKYIAMHPELPYDLHWTDPKKRALHKPYFVDFFKWMLKEVRVDPLYKNRLVIVEGCNITYLGAEFMSTQPIIIMGCSRLQAFIRRIKRNIVEHPEQKNVLAHIFHVIDMYKKFGKDLDDEKDAFRKGIEKINSTEVLY